jgi:plasmid maintenance system antidote protein VapI
MNDQRKSIPDLAAVIGVQQSTLRGFLDGYRGLPSDVLDALADQLGTSPAYLAGRSDDPRTASQIEEQSRRPR